MVTGMPDTSTHPMPQPAYPPVFKMNGAGNDFIVFDARQTPLTLSAEQCRALADRDGGIGGCDQILVIEAGSGGSDAFLRVWNADGSASAACGNGARCVALLLAGGVIGREIVLDTGERLLVCRVVGEGEVRVDMGAPIWEAERIPVAGAVSAAVFAPLLPAGVSAVDAVGMGNPHGVCFMESAEALARVGLERVGAALERHEVFPQRANISFAWVAARERLEARVWERGAGATLCCGTAACAVFACARRRRWVEASARVCLPGGELLLEERAEDGHILMSGAAALDAEGLDVSGFLMEEEARHAA